MDGDRGRTARPGRLGTLPPSRVGGLSRRSARRRCRCHDRSRDQTTLQLGLSPVHGTVLAGLRDGDEVVLAALDGRHDLSDLHALARTRSLPVRRVDQLLRVLSEAGVLVAAELRLPDDQAPDGSALDGSAPDGGSAPVVAVEPAPRLTPDEVSWALAYQAAADRAHDVDGDGGDQHLRDGAGDGALDPAALLPRRATAHVRVDGLGRLGAAVATTLAACGVGRVEGNDTAPVRPDDVLPGGHHPDDVGTSRAASLARALDRAVPRAPTPRGPPHPTTTTTTAPSTAPGPDLVVLVRDDAVELAAADDLVHRAVPHLAVVVAADRVVVGPLVVPGCGPCLRCLHLHRCDRDPAWPQLVAQLTRPSVTGPVPRGEAASTTAATGLTALQALSYLDGVVRPVSLGRTLDLALPDGLVERRRWTPHPRCGCTRLPGPLPASGPTRTSAPGGGQRPRRPCAVAGRDRQ